ncbi:arabinofuranosyltransferase [Kineococcus gynurae]|uniref:Galactan 5-O-arabinofuranosyltransferase n=1 Tax=Kineococcus gynurae TaxID=452979 RepID=A0ABV5LRF7_9ACTN
MSQATREDEVLRTPERPVGTRDAIVRGGFARLLGALLGTAALAGVVSLLAQLVVERVVAGWLPYASITPTYGIVAVATLLVLVAVALTLLAVVRRAWWRGTEALAVVGLSGFATLLLAIPLAGARFYLGGNSVDQMFRTQLLGRLTDDWHLADMNYAETAPFYPSGWFWLAGRFAALSGEPAWEAFKWAGIATSAIVPCLALVAWSRLVGPRRGLLAGLATAVVGVYPALAGPFVDEPYSWCLAAFVPLVAVTAWKAFGDVPPTARLSAGVAIGVVLGFGAMSYTLYAGFAAFVVALACLARVIGAWRAGEGPAALRGRVPALVLAAVVSGILALVVWLPYVIAVATGGSGRAAAQHFLPLISTQVPTPMFQATPWGAFLLFGLGWAVLAARRSDLARPLLLVLALAYLWYPLSTLALAGRTTLLAFRMEAIIVETLAVAAVLGAAAVYRALPAWLAATPFADRARDVRALAVVLAAAVFVVPLQATPQNLADPIAKAYTDYQADGRTALGVSNEEDAGAWTDDVRAAVDEVGGGVPADQLVVLSAVYEWFSFAPWFGFQQVTPHYANPLSDYDARRDEVLSWSRATSSAELVQRLRESRFARPDVFVLRTTGDGYQIGLARDVFPREPNVEWVTATFDPALFSGPEFTVREVGPFAVIGFSG